MSREIIQFDRAMLVCARIRYVTANEWSNRRYLDMSRLGDSLPEAN